MVANIHDNMHMILASTCLDKDGVFLTKSHIVCVIHGECQRLGFSDFLASPVMSYFSFPFNKHSSSRCEQKIFLTLFNIEIVKLCIHISIFSGLGTLSIVL